MTSERQLLEGIVPIFNEIFPNPNGEPRFGFLECGGMTLLCNTVEDSPRAPTFITQNVLAPVA